MLLSSTIPQAYVVLRVFFFAFSSFLIEKTLVLRKKCNALGKLKDRRHGELERHRMKDENTQAGLLAGNLIMKQETGGRVALTTPQIL